MKFNKQLVMESAVGLFSFAVLAALIVLTVILSHEALFRASLPMEVVFEDVMGLRVGDNVNSRGVTVGKVKQLLLREDGVHVMAMLDVPVYLREDYRMEVRASSVLGGRYLSIHEGTPSSQMLEPPPPVLQGSPSADLIDSATKAVEDIRTALNDGIIEDFKATMANIRGITDRLGSGEGTLARLINDATVYEDVQQLTANLRQLSDSLADGEGTLGKLITDEAVYTDAQAIAANFRDLSDRLVRGEGTLGRLLMSDDQVYEDLAATMASLRGVMETVGRGEGTIGRLLSDEEMYLEFRSLLREGRAALDDIRETSPITTFTSIFFGAF
ncbi:MAG: MlaD family protein [Verrucomicrobiota bacterium]|jgi:phospholipid/cholesterol/gamma-HCH transport system substrate-binding protein|nr:MlaD family protein [Verrucomicrobiota bacterium]